MYVSGHGYGHFMRTAAFLEHACARIDCRLEVCATAPAALWPDSLKAITRAWRSRPCDVGVVQPHQLAVDAAATADALRAWSAAYPARVDEEVRALTGHATAVLGDVPPLAFDAASVAGVPAFALASFSWDWIYSRMGFTDAAREAARAYGHATALFELTPSAPMDAFERRLPLGVLGRTAVQGRHVVRDALGIAAHERLVLVAFRERELCALPPESIDVRYIRCGVAPEPRRDVVGDTRDFGFHDLLAAADAVVAKAGYGIIGDACTAATPLLYALRSGFPEDEVLDAWLQPRAWARRTEAARLAAGEWLEDLEELLCRERPEPLRPDVGAGVRALAAALGA